MGSMNMYNHNKILRMLTRCITIAITFLFISCESWYSYCFDINNNTNDSVHKRDGSFCIQGKNVNYNYIWI